jgi:hypothetical protein
MTSNATVGASMTIASTVSRRGWRRRHGTPRTIHATGETRSSRTVRKNRESRRAAGVSVPGVAGACVPRSRTRSLSSRWKFSCTSAAVGASVPRPHATSPKPAAPAHSARARCRRPAAQCPAPAAAWVTTGTTKGTHPDVVEGLDPSRRSKATHRSRALLLSSRAIPSLSPWRRVCANARSGPSGCRCSPRPWTTTWPATGRADPVSRDAGDLRVCRHFRVHTGYTRKPQTVERSQRSQRLNMPPDQAIRDFHH